MIADQWIKGTGIPETFTGDIVDVIDCDGVQFDKVDSGKLGWRRVIFWRKHVEIVPPLAPKVVMFGDNPRNNLAAEIYKDMLAGLDGRSPDKYDAEMLATHAIAMADIFAKKANEQ